MDWVLAHMEDPDINDDVAPLLLAKNGTSSGGRGAGDEYVTQEAMDMLANYGLSEVASRCALIATKGNLERAADWAFSHEGQDPEAALVAVNGGSVGGGAPSTSTTCPGIGDAGQGKYELFATVSHIGRNLDHGHYVCHVKKDDRWVLFDDDRVALSTVPPLDRAYMYFFRKV